MYIDGTNIINECNEKAVNSDDNINKDDIPVIGPFSSGPFIPVILSVLSQNFADPLAFAEASVLCEEKEKIVWSGNNNHININISICSSFNTCDTITCDTSKEGIPICTKCNKERNDTTLEKDERLYQQAKLPSQFDSNLKKGNNNKLSVKEQKARAKAWAINEFGPKNKTIIKLSVEEQKARANAWAIKEFGHLLNKKETNKNKNI